MQCKLIFTFILKLFPVSSKNAGFPVHNTVKPEKTKHQDYIATENASLLYSQEKYHELIKMSHLWRNQAQSIGLWGRAKVATSLWDVWVWWYTVKIGFGYFQMSPVSKWTRNKLCAEKKHRLGCQVLMYSASTALQKTFDFSPPFLLHDEIATLTQRTAVIISCYAYFPRMEK